MSGDAAFTDKFFTTEDGPRIHYRDYPAVGAESGPPVLCLHGLTRNVKDFEDLAPRIAELGHRVIVASQRGRGRSDRDPQVERYQPPIYAGDMIDLLGALGIGKAVFIGTSMGGLMTMLIAAQRPDLMAGAVLNDIGPEIAPAGIERIMTNVSSRDPVDDWDQAAERTRASNIDAFPDRTDPAYWLDFARKTWVEGEDGRLHLDYDGAIIDQLASGAALPDLWPYFDALIPIPSLLVLGGITDIIAPETVTEMKRRKPDLAIAVVPRVGHAPFMTETQAWQAIRDLLTA